MRRPSLRGVTLAQRAGSSWGAAVFVIYVAGCRSTTSRADATSLARSAITVDGTAGVVADVHRTAPQDADAATSGSAQLARMVADRARLREVLSDHADVRAWLAARFVGTDRGFAVEWDPTEPLSGQPAEHMQPQAPGEAARLRVATGYSGNDQLAGVVYEFINMDGANAMSAAWGEARAGRVTRQEFAERMTRLEFDALVGFQHFAHEHALAARTDDVMLPRLLGAPSQFGAFVEWSTRLRRESGGHSPQEYWGRLYDSAARGAATHAM